MTETGVLAGVGWGRAIILRAALGFAVGKDLECPRGGGKVLPIIAYTGRLSP